MRSIKNILVASDLSREGQSMLVYASELAKHFNSKVYILHVYNIEIPVSEVDYAYMDDMDNQKREEIREKFDQIESTFFYSHFPDHEFIMQSGSIEDDILLAIQEKHIDLLIMGSSDPNAFFELVGTHTTHLVNRVKKPILIIPGNTPYKEFKKILLATDLQKISSELQILKLLIEEYRAELEIITVEKKVHAWTHKEMATAKILEKIFIETNVKYHYEKKENEESAILKFVEKNKVDLLAVTPHPHSVWERITQKSLTKRLLYHSKIPLLILHE